MSVHVLDPRELIRQTSPFAGLFHSRMRGREFPPHPHAGFSAITYVLEDSRAALRNRDSLGNDFVTHPGGIVWTQAGSGVLHEEVPAEDDRELHGVQVFINLHALNKLAPPKVFHVDSREVPEWRDDTGDRVRVVVGSFLGISSPLVPSEPANLLDIDLRREVRVEIESGHNALVYVLEGEIAVRTDEREQRVQAYQALALHSTGGCVMLRSEQPAHVLVLSSAEIREPVIFDGHFMMNEQAQIDAAAERYRNGLMGSLEPLAEG